MLQANPNQPEKAQETFLVELTDKQAQKIIGGRKSTWQEERKQKLIKNWIRKYR